MATPPAGPGWQPDLERDSLSFRMLDLGRTLLDMLHDDPDREAELIELMTAHVAAQAAMGKNLMPFEGFIPIAMLQVSGTELVFLGRLEGREGYALAIQGDTFAVMARLLYDVENADLYGGTLLSFRGEAAAAIRWLGLMNEAIREGEVDPFLPMDLTEPTIPVATPANQP